MARHQRQGSRAIFTHARPADAAFQLELPGEAGLMPPPRETREPSAWIIAGAEASPREPMEVPPARHPTRSVVHGAEAPARATATQIIPAAATQALAAATQALAPAPGAARPAATTAPPLTPPLPARPDHPPAETLHHAPDTTRLEAPPEAPPAPLVEQPPPTGRIPTLRPSVGESELHPAIPPGGGIYLPAGPTIDERILQEATSKAASILAEAERERFTVLEQARGEAAQQLEEARAERERLLAQTRAEAEATLAEARQIHAEAHDKGREEGFEAGQVDARAAAYAQMEEKVGDLIAAIQNLTRDAMDERHGRIDAMEPELVALALEIAEKIITQEVQSSPDVIAAIARDAIGRVRDRQELVIHCSPVDLETLQRYRDQFIRLEDLGNLRIVEDSRVGPGGILIETAAGEIDARVELQLDRIRQEFQEVMETHAAPPPDRPE